MTRQRGSLQHTTYALGGVRERRPVVAHAGVRNRRLSRDTEREP
jgi:hypothetical protein